MNERKTEKSKMEMAPLRHAMAAPARLRVELATGAGLELLIGLYATGTPDSEREESWAPKLAACPPATRAALGAIGERAGEVWLHLLGLALATDAPDRDAFVETVAAVRPLELRRHLLGAYVPAWLALVGADTIEAAARGDERAAQRLLEHDRYYGGRARESLALLLPLSAAETKRR